jgi:hypothetical protein
MAGSSILEKRTVETVIFASEAVVEFRLRKGPWIILGIVVAGCASVPVQTEPQQPTGITEAVQETDAATVALDKTAVEVRAFVPHPPVRFVLSDKHQLAWELFLVNDGDVAVELERVLADLGDHKLTIDAEDLAKDFVVLETDVSRASRLRRVSPKAPVLEPGAVGVVYLWSDTDTKAKTIEHSVEVRGAAVPIQVTTPISASVPRTVGPPLVGGGWFVGFSSDNRSPHRRSVFVGDDGTYFGAQRYAIDIVRIDEKGGRSQADPSRNDSYYAYGVEVVAIADGTVVQIIDGIPDNTPGACPRPSDSTAPCERKTAVPITRQTLAGNALVVDIGGVFVTYAHLLPGSLVVHEGDTVVKGQGLAKLGNSGNTSEPHLHLHACDGPSVFTCQGVPLHFERFLTIPIDPSRGPTGPPRMVHGEFPAGWNLLVFPDADGNMPGPPR